MKSALPKNLGYPVNSHFNEFGLSLNSDQTIGYISSDRAEERTLGDLYSFAVNQIRAIGVVIEGLKPGYELQMDSIQNML